ncbi:MAG: hypothetical protein KGO79_08250 [Betaproteobacteria bacterium]|nr:hypothetical protein [Betaproteobacteria bacterium]
MRDWPENLLALVSGHTLKHVLAAIGIVVLVSPLFSRPRAQAESVNT